VETFATPGSVLILNLSVFDPTDLKDRQDHENPRNKQNFHRMSVGMVEHFRHGEIQEQGEPENETRPPIDQPVESHRAQILPPAHEKGPDFLSRFNVQIDFHAKTRTLTE
jgi:hypothetical protein